MQEARFERAVDKKRFHFLLLLHFPPALWCVKSHHSLLNLASDMRGKPPQVLTSTFEGEVLFEDLSHAYVQCCMTLFAK